MSLTTQTRPTGQVTSQTQHPQALRLRRPSWRDPRLLIGLALVAGSVVAGAKVVSAGDHTTPYYVAAHPLAPGSRLTPGDLKLVNVQLGETANGYLSGSATTQGQVVVAPVAAGQLVPSAAISDPGALTISPVTVTAANVTAEQLKEGARVDVWVSAADPEKSGKFLPGQQVVTNATVRNVAKGNGFAVSGDASVTLMVPKSSVGALLDAKVNGAVINLVPVAGQ